MKTLALALAFVVAFACGILVERSRFQVDTVENPFGAPTIEQQQLLDKMDWQVFDSNEIEYQADVLVGEQE